MENTCEFEEMQSLAAQAKLGSILLIPLRYRTGWNPEMLDSIAETLSVDTTDICEAIKKSLQRSKDPILRRYRLPNELLYQKIRLAAGANRIEEDLYVCKNGDPLSPAEDHIFRLHSCEVYSFRHVAFFCLGITYQKIEQLRCILNPGYAASQATYFVRDPMGEYHPFSLDEAIAALCADFRTEPFFQSGTSLFLEAYSYNEVLLPKRFRALETLKQLSYNLHIMAPLDTAGIDGAEEDLRYIFAAKDTTLQSYRWGCCVSLQSVAFVAAAEDLNIGRELEARFEDELPPVILALYQKYTCIRLSEMQSELLTNRTRALRALQRCMLDFKAFGIIYPNLLSRWDNVRQIYLHLFELNGIEHAVEDLDNKITILVDSQREKQENTENAIGWIISIFGFLSILESVVSMIDLYQGGTPSQHMILLLTSLCLTVIFMVTILLQRRKWK